MRQIYADSCESVGGVPEFPAHATVSRGAGEKVLTAECRSASERIRERGAKSTAVTIDFR